jgi:hypothetical protein
MKSLDLSRKKTEKLYVTRAIRLHPSHEFLLRRSCDLRLSTTVDLVHQICLCHVGLCYKGGAVLILGVVPRYLFDSPTSVSSFRISLSLSPTLFSGDGRRPARARGDSLHRTVPVSWITTDLVRVLVPSPTHFI